MRHLFGGANDIYLTPQEIINVRIKKMSGNILKSKRIHIIAICLLITFVVGIASLFGINGYVKSSVKDMIISAEDAASLDADCILVLGARVYEDGTLCPMLQDRLIQGIELYNLGA